ncbi:N-acetylmuramoyl-L-alanine amidase [Hathewaya histolytica]|uniref:N-acetylmuramoyl-L-alanine amidase n=1 Tax=Hathewaya histolytica TaxID=1498 RepID=A0A4U9RGS8_HATHI|nr:N-acetylmuramoyl-L-alanine amidase [Hathewaya histolytica]VTQ89663.1 N-acetylmuramoyl-L-alanine amidase [Hathewaya histolytica]
MKIGIDTGHTLTGADTGAQGNGLREEVLTREVGKYVISKLKALGHTVMECALDNADTLGQSLAHRYNTANDNNVDLFVSIHFNCFNSCAYGTEVFTWKGNKTSRADAVLKNLVSLGFVNRGIKDGSKLAVIKNTKAESMLIEVCFIDNVTDIARYKNYGPEKIADAIVKGLVGESIGTSTQKPVVPTPQKPISQIESKKTWEINIQGDIIRRLQAELNNQFGAGIKVDGYAGDNTVNKLITVRSGARGNITRIVQELLIRKGYSVGSYGADGVFGQGTYKAILQLQSKNGLSADGIVGKNTWKVLLKK